MARDGITKLTYVNPGYQPGRFHRRRDCRSWWDAKGRSIRAIDAWYRKFASNKR